MKKAIVVMLLVFCMAALFAATITTQTIVLVSVVEEIRPSFSLEVNNVANGFVLSNNGSEAIIEAFDVKKDVSVNFSIYQSLSRYKGGVDVSITISELRCNNFSTKGMELCGQVNEVVGRTGYSVVSGNTIDLYFDYSGSAVDCSSAAEISVRYNGDSSLPEGEYISYIKMSYVVE